MRCIHKTNMTQTKQAMYIIITLMVPITVSYSRITGAQCKQEVTSFQSVSWLTEDGVNKTASLP